MMRYIEAEHEVDLRQFKYKGTCVSISYKYLWSPLAEYLLRFVPETVAPNVITLVAFAIIVVSHIVFMFWGEGGNNFTEVLPPWKYALFAVSLFLYQHLDNMDGKQARRTKNSSAVGMLFDHGCDAITSMLVGIQFLRLIQVQHVEGGFYAIIALIMVPNFILIWVQYGIGAFHLDVVNPIDDGLPSFQILALFGFFLNYSFWRQHHWFTSYNYELLLGFLVLVFIVCGKMTRNVLQETTRKRNDMLGVLILPAVLVAIVVAVKLSGLSELVYGEHFYLYFYTFVFFWGRNEIQMQTCSVTNQQFNPLNWSTLLFAASLALPILLPPLRSHLSTYLIGCLLLQAVLLVELAISFLRQAASVLGIRLFAINPPPKAQ